MRQWHRGRAREPYGGVDSVLLPVNAIIITTMDTFCVLYLNEHARENAALTKLKSFKHKIMIK